MLPTLDARLSAAAELVRPGEPVADIGCDHGKLTAVLAASGKYPKVIGADLRPGPLAKAEQTLEYAGCKDRAELRLGDGLSVLSPGEVSTIVLAGVSAEGETRVHDIRHIDRGYEDYVGKLGLLGADIERVTIDDALPAC